MQRRYAFERSVDIHAEEAQAYALVEGAARLLIVASTHARRAGRPDVQQPIEAVRTVLDEVRVTLGKDIGELS